MTSLGYFNFSEYTTRLIPRSAQGAIKFLQGTGLPHGSGITIYKHRVAGLFLDWHMWLLSHRDIWHRQTEPSHTGDCDITQPMIRNKNQTIRAQMKDMGGKRGLIVCRRIGTRFISQCQQTTIFEKKQKNKKTSQSPRCLRVIHESPIFPRIPSLHEQDLPRWPSASVLKWNPLTGKDHCKELLWWVHTVLNHRFSVSGQKGAPKHPISGGGGEDGSRSRAKTVDIVNTKRLACWIRIVDWSEEWAFYSQVIIFIRAWSRRLKEIEPLLTPGRARGLHTESLSTFDAQRPHDFWIHIPLSLESESWLSRECTCLYSSKFSEINLIELFR